MQLSILLPTNRRGPAALARIAQACSWASANVEVVVRDNSGDDEKRALIACLRREHCQIVSVAPCEPAENYSQILGLAKGEFIFLLSDDDHCPDRAVAALPSLLDHYGGNAAVVGVTGTYALETSQGTGIANYKDLDADDLVARVTGYLSYPGPNLLFYAVRRREIANRVMTFAKSMPVYLSFHDQVLSLLYLLSGKFVTLPRLFYIFDFGVWEASESAQKCDLGFYTAAGLDPAVNKLQWLLCGFEGAALTMNLPMFAAYPGSQRQRVADTWFTTMFGRFNRDLRSSFDSPFTGEADKLCAKLRGATGQLSFESMLTEISTFFMLFSPQKAQAYFDFWSAILGKREPAASKLAVAG